MEHHAIEGEITIPNFKDFPKAHLKAKSAFVRAIAKDLGTVPNIILGRTSSEQVIQFGQATLSVTNDRMSFNAYSASGFSGYEAVKHFTAVMADPKSHMARLMRRAKINGGFDVHQHYEEVGVSHPKGNYACVNGRVTYNQSAHALTA